MTPPRWSDREEGGRTAWVRSPLGSRCLSFDGPPRPSHRREGHRRLLELLHAARQCWHAVVGGWRVGGWVGRLMSGWVDGWLGESARGLGMGWEGITHHRDYLATTWRLPGDYLATTWQLPGNYLPTTWQLPANYLATTWQLPGNYLATTWQLPCRQVRRRPKRKCDPYAVLGCHRELARHSTPLPTPPVGSQGRSGRVAQQMAISNQRTLKGVACRHRLQVD